MNNNTNKNSSSKCNQLQSSDEGYKLIASFIKQVSDHINLVLRAPSHSDRFVLSNQGFGAVPDHQDARLMSELNKLDKSLLLNT